MKLSLAWIFDHIDADWKKIDIENLVDQFNKITAEIEGFEKISIDLAPLSLVQVKGIGEDSVTVFSDEWKKEFKLPLRDELLENCYYMIVQQGKNVRWAEAHDWQSKKECLIPALYCDKKDISGGWKKTFQKDDYVLEIDNKTITNRPDMWGHRGFAREIAAILKLPLKPLHEFLREKKIAQFDTTAQATEKHPFTIKVEDKKVGKRFAGLYVENVEYRASSIWMANRLLRVESRPISLIVDTTNYVMLDLSEPMHAFDADKITTEKVIPRFAANKEKLTLLDGQEIELTAQDYVISDGKKPLALAGIMGGLETAVTQETDKIFLEAACFDATTIRRSSFRHKVRTEASMRFEKSLDPNQNTLAIMRFLQLIDESGIVFQAADEIASVGKPVKDIVLTLVHDFIEKRLGTPIAQEFIVQTLERLGFGVKLENSEYQITVPSFRSSKDVTIPEDLVEEIGRFYGYTQIPLVLPNREMKAFPLQTVLRKRSIKELLAYSLKMHEITPYAFFDESFLSVLEWQPKKALTLKTPGSENWRQLVTSLIPNLLKAVDDNAADYDRLRFFEWASTWPTGTPENEKPMLSGLFFNKKEAVDFYEYKALVSRLYEMLKIEVEWQQVEKVENPWFMPYQTAYILHKGERVGIAGKIDTAFLNKITEGDAFAFELDADFLLNYKVPIMQYKPVSKYQAIERDVSIFVPLAKTVSELTTLIGNADSMISSVSLVDMFEKAAWGDKKSLTFRFVLHDHKKTLSKEETDEIWNKVATSLKSKGAEIR